jgi:CheY-like chemotaxis protein
MRILVIDDDAFVVKLMVESLKKRGHDVEFTMDGLSGARNFENSTFDAVICDLVMPKQDGETTIQEIRQNRPDVAIVAISGGVPSGETTSFHKLMNTQWLGADVVLKKPFRVPELIAAVEEAVNKQWAKTTDSLLA